MVSFLHVSPDTHHFVLTAGTLSEDHTWVTSHQSVNTGMAGLYIPSLFSALGPAPNAELVVSVAMTSGANGALLSLSPPELLASTAPAQSGCHSLSATSPSPSFTMTATASDMTPKDCVRTCLGAGRRFAYLRAGDTCLCEADIRADLPPASEERCQVRTNMVWWKSFTNVTGVSVNRSLSRMINAIAT